MRDDMIGQKFGSWTVDSYAGQVPKSLNHRFHCTCECGTKRVVTGTLLRTGKSTKCKCCRGKVNNRQSLYSRHNGYPVYFVRCGDYVKIGASKNISRRIRDLEGANPYPLELLETDENEEFWHNVFKHRHHRGEWYHFPTGVSCEL